MRVGKLILIKILDQLAAVKFFICCNAWPVNAWLLLWVAATLYHPKPLRFVSSSAGALKSFSLSKIGK